MTTNSLGLAVFPFEYHANRHDSPFTFHVIGFNQGSRDSHSLQMNRELVPPRFAFDPQILGEILLDTGRLRC